MGSAPTETPYQAVADGHSYRNKEKSNFVKNSFGFFGGFASFHACFGRLRAAWPFTLTLPSPLRYGGTARLPSRPGGSARGGATARGPRGPERCVAGAGPGRAGGVPGWAVFPSNDSVIPSVQHWPWGRGFPLPSLTAGRLPQGRAVPPWAVPTHADPYCQPR